MTLLKHLSTTQKTVNFILFFVFVLFAIVQINDPDPAIWISIYATVAIIALGSNFKVFPKILLLIFIGILIIYAAYHFSLFLDYLRTDHKEEIFGKMVYQKPYLEGSREFLGLLMGAASVYYQKTQTPNQ